MSTSQPQQQGGTTTPAKPGSQQQGQAPTSSPQQGSTPVFKDWASI